MLINNWLKSLTIPASRRDRRRGRAASGVAMYSQGSLHCGASVEKLEEKALLAVTPELVTQVGSGADGSDAFHSVNMNGILFFPSTDAAHGTELWRSDGTAAGTMLVKDIQTGSVGSSPSYLTNVNGTLYFAASDGVNGRELWKSDGTAAGTVLVKDIQIGSNGSDPKSLVNVNGKLFFAASDGAQLNQLWQSDGTANGTTLITSIVLGANAPTTFPADLTNINGTLFFRAGRAGSFFDQQTPILWKSDGTAAGTDIIDGSPSHVVHLTNVNGTLFFSANVSTQNLGMYNSELWKLASTGVNPTLVRDIRSDGQSSYPSSLTNVNGTLFFSARGNGTFGTELWQSDGTAPGTTLVKDIRPGTNNGSYPAELTNVNDILFFIANDGTNGTELWQSDGTAAGTTVVQTIQSSSLTNVNGTLFFNAGTNGNELWKAVVPSGLSLGGTVWIDGNINRTFESGADFPSGIVALTLFKGDGTTVVTTGATDANGNYQFTNLLPGDYIVRVDASNFGSGKPLAGLVTILGSTDPDNNINNDDNGVDNANPATNGIRSLPITLALGTEPDGLAHNNNNSLGFGFALTTPVLNTISNTQGVRPTLSWQPVAGATHYEIWFSRTFPIAQRIYLDSNVTTTSWTPPIDLESGFFRYWVRALDAAGHSSTWSAANSFQVRPMLISPLAGTFINPPTFQWRTVPGASSYQLTIRSGSGDQLIQNIATNSYTPPTALPAGPIQWWVRATGAPQNSGWSIIGHLDPTPQSHVTGPMSPASSTPQITWSIVPGAGRYILHVENIANPGVAVIRQDNLTGTDFTPTIPLSAGKYRAWVKAINGNTNAFNSGIWSRPFDFTVAASEADQAESLLNPDSGLTLTSLQKQLSPVVKTGSLRDSSSDREIPPVEIDAAQLPVSNEGFAGLAHIADAAHPAFQTRWINSVSMEQVQNTLDMSVVDLVMEQSDLLAAMLN